MAPSVHNGNLACREEQLINVFDTNTYSVVNIFDITIRVSNHNLMVSIICQKWYSHPSAQPMAIQVGRAGISVKFESHYAVHYAVQANCSQTMPFKKEHKLNAIKRARMPACTQGRAAAVPEVDVPEGNGSGESRESAGRGRRNYVAGLRRQGCSCKGLQSKRLAAGLLQKKGVDARKD
eukprot:scaffold76660_cov20-Tisochrysis_lutea.AAC.2